MSLSTHPPFFPFVLEPSQALAGAHCSPVTDYIFQTSLTCCSVTKSCLTPRDPIDCSTPGFPVLHISQSLLKLMSIELVMLSNHLVLCRPLLFLLSIHVTKFESVGFEHLNPCNFWIILLKIKLISLDFLCSSLVF